MRVIGYLGFLLVCAFSTWLWGRIFRQSLALEHITCFRHVCLRSANPIEYWLYTCFTGIATVVFLVITIYMLTGVLDAFSEQCRNVPWHDACSQATERGR